jgi:biopolymer transport protein ExbD
MTLTAKRRKRTQVGIPLTPLIDIVFLLLIYFLLTTNFLVEEGINVNLPQAQASSPQVKTEITVCVDRRGKTFLADREVSLGTLFTLVKEQIGSDAERPVVIKADREVVLNAAVRVMDVVRAAGATRLSLATERDL